MLINSDKDGGPTTTAAGIHHPPPESTASEREHARAGDGRRLQSSTWQDMYLLMSFFQLTRRFTDSNGKLRTGIAQHLAHTIGGTLIQTVRRWMHLGERAWNLCETT
jgi:hypothetical protein